MQKSAVKWLYKVPGRKKIYIVLLTIVQCLNGASGVLYALFLRGIVDSAVGRDKNGFIFNAICIVALVLIQLTLNAITRWLSELSRSTFENLFKERLMHNILRKDFGRVSAVHSGEWLNRLTNDTTLIANNYTDIIPGFAGMAVKMISALVMITVLDPRFALILIPLGILLGLLTFAFRKNMKKLHKKVQEKEEAGDRYEDALGSYLVKLTGQEMTIEQQEYVSKYLHTISDLELISDQALVIAIGCEKAREKFGSFSGDAGHELEVMASAVEKAVDLATQAFTDNDLSIAERIEPLEELIDNLCDTMKLNHVDRLQKKVCTIAQGFVFNDIISGCERISDHCSNIAIAMIVLGHDSYDMHEYLTNLHEERSSVYEHYYEEYKKEFDISVVSSIDRSAAPFVEASSTGFGYAPAE